MNCRRVASGWTLGASSDEDDYGRIMAGINSLLMDSILCSNNSMNWMLGGRSPRSGSVFGSDSLQCRKKNFELFSFKLITLEKWAFLEVVNAVL